MKKYILLLFFVFTAITSTRLMAQTAEERAAQSYTQNYTLTTTKGIKSGGNYYLFDGKKYTEKPGEVVWVGSTAVMNSEDGSFQVIFKSIPTVSKKYIIQPYGTFYDLGKEGESSIALLTDGYDTQFWSVTPNKGKIQVKIKGNKIHITVKNVEICVNGINNCKTITGQIILGKE